MYKNIRFDLSARPIVVDPVPTFLEEVRAIMDQDKVYTDFLLRLVRDEIIEELVVCFYSWLYALYLRYLYIDFEGGAKKWGALFSRVLSALRQLLSVLRQWLVFWLEGIYFD